MTTKTTTYGIQDRAGFRSKNIEGACSACVVARRFLLILLLSALLTPLSTFFSACGHDDLVPDDVYVEETTPYVELRIAIPFANQNATRANPIGGEEGNGREQGIINEDIVHDINIFFYKDGKGLDGSPSTPIDYHIFFNIDNMLDEDNSHLLDGSEPIFDKHYLSLKLEFAGKLAELGVGTHFAAVANIGKIQDPEVKNLGDLTSLNVAKFSGAWSTSLDAYSCNASKMDYFLMSTAYNDNYKGSGSNTITENSSGKYTGTATLERMYSRIDLWYDKEKNAGNNETVTELKYGIVDSEGKDVIVDVKDADGNNITDTEGNNQKAAFANVYLTNVLPVNVMKEPSYLFKKVTQRLNSWDLSNLIKQTDVLIKWAGIEEVDGNGMPYNYVMERHTTNKTVGGGTSKETLTDWYGKTAVEYVSGKSKYKSSDAASSDVTTALDCSIKNTDIGKLSGYYHDTPASTTTPNYGCDQIAIISYANENTHPTDCYHSNYLTGMAFRAVYIPENIYTDYTMTTSTGEDGKTETTTTLQALVQSVTSFDGGKIFRYSPTTKEQKESNSLYFTSKTKAEDYAKDHPGDMAIISEGYAAEKHTLADGTGKWGFVCYYNLWLRHYNNEAGDPTENYPMEYATVRNNIYRVSVSFRGPGDPEPTMREPDTMKARIFVRKWNYKEEPTINFDL